MPLSSYTLKRHARSRSVRIRIGSDGTCVVTAPKRVPKWVIDGFVRQKTQWIQKHVKKAKQRPVSLMRSGSSAEYKERKGEALKLVEARLKHFNAFYKFDYKNVSIRNQKTRWGSCSSTGTLSFNYRIIHLPPEAQDYIIVHELCHLSQMNHSLKFWKLVERCIPNHKAIRKIVQSIR